MTEDPATYACWCGYYTTDVGEVERHITVHTPSRMTTIAAVTSTAAGVEIRSTPYGDDRGAVEFVVITHAAAGYRHTTVLVDKRSIPFLIEQLEAHRLGEDSDPCPACAAQAFVARVATTAMRTKHTCPEPRKVEPCLSGSHPRSE